MTRVIPWPDFLRERDARIAAQERAAASERAAIRRCRCGAPLLSGETYQCGVCRDRELGIAITNLERDRERRQRDGTGWRPGIRICYATECYPPEEV